MTKDELKDYIRTLADDTVAPYRTSDADIYAYIAEAEREAFERALLTKTDATYDLSIVSGTASYALDDLIFQVDRLKISGEDRPLSKTTKRELDFQLDKWEIETGTPQYFYQQNKTITLYPIPDANGTLLVDAWRYPESEMETPTEMQADLAYWPLYKIFLQLDADINAPELAAMNLAKFNEAFGSKRSFKHHRNMQDVSDTSPMYRHPFQ